MCVNCGKGGCQGCDHPVEIKNSSQIIYDGPKLDYPGIGVVIEKCTPLNEVIDTLFSKLNEFNP